MTTALATPATLEIQDELVRRARSGDESSIRELYDRYVSRIYDFTLGMLRNRDDAEDATSETFMRFVEGIAALRDEAAFTSWLYAIARNAALRVAERRTRSLPVAEYRDGDHAVTAEPPKTPDESAEMDDLRGLLERAALSLSKREQAVFDLSVRHGLSSAEVAVVLGLRPAYAYILITRLKRSLGEAVEAQALVRASKCAGLSQVVENHGTTSAIARRAIHRHAHHCTVCSEVRRRRASLSALFQGVAYAEPSAEFATDLATRLSSAQPASPHRERTTARNHLVHIGGGVVTLLMTVAVTTMAPQRTIGTEIRIMAARTVQAQQAADPGSLETTSSVIGATEAIGAGVPSSDGTEGKLSRTRRPASVGSDDGDGNQGGSSESNPGEPTASFRNTSQQQFRDESADEAEETSNEQDAPDESKTPKEPANSSDNTSYQEKDQPQ